MALTSAEYQELVQSISGRKPWYVNAAAASDAGDGKCPSQAKKTIAAGVALCSPGDALFLTGQFTDQLNLSSSTDLVVDGGNWNTQISDAGSPNYDNPISMGTRCLVKNLAAIQSSPSSAESGTNTTPCGIFINSVDQAVLENVYVISNCQGVTLNDSTDTQLLNVLINSGEAGISWTGSTGVIRNSQIHSKDWPTCDQMAIGVNGTKTGYLEIWDSVFRSVRGGSIDANTLFTTGLYLLDGIVIAHGSSFYGYDCIADIAKTSTASGVYDGSSSSISSVNLQGCVIRGRSDIGAFYDIDGTGSGANHYYDLSTIYRTNKISQTFPSAKLNASSVAGYIDGKISYSGLQIQS